MRDKAEQLVGKHADMILRLSYTYLKSTHDAKDICQDVLVKLLTREAPFANDEHERAWVVRFTINACKNLLASATRTRTVALDEAAAIPAPDEPSGEVWDAVNELPAEQREAVYLHYYEGYRIADIAAFTGKSEAAIAKSLSRARAKLRTMLEGEEYGIHVS